MATTALKITLLAIAFSAIAAITFGQFDLSPSDTAATPRIGEVRCPDRSEQSACDSFSELRTANDETIDSLIEPAHSPSTLSFVCFADSENDFFTLRYANDPAHAQRWTLYTAWYNDGVPAPTDALSLVAHRSASSRASEDVPPPFLISVSPGRLATAMTGHSGLGIFSMFKNLDGGNTEKDLTIQLHTGRFKITESYDSPPMGPGKSRNTGSLPDVEGRCVNLWQFVNHPSLPPSYSIETPASLGDSVSSAIATPKTVPIPPGATIGDPTPSLHAQQPSGSVLRGNAPSYIWIAQFDQEDRAQDALRKIQDLGLTSVVIPRRAENGKRAFVVLTGPFPPARIPSVIDWLRSQGFQNVREIKVPNRQMQGHNPTLNAPNDANGP